MNQVEKKTKNSEESKRQSRIAGKRRANFKQQKTRKDIPDYELPCKVDFVITIRF